MSAPEKQPVSAAATRDAYTELAFEIYIAMAARIYSAPANPESKKPDPKALGLMCFKLAEAFLAAEKETPRARAEAEALSKARVNLDDVDMSSVFKSTIKP